MSEGAPAPAVFPDPALVERYAGRTLGIEDILDLLPHRPPMLLVDRIIALDPGVSAVGVKGVTIGEPFFAGHFPGHPIMPGVLIIEALAQVGGVLMMTGLERGGRVPYFTRIKDAKFREPVLPGCLLELHVRADQVKFRFGRLVCWMTMQAKVDGSVAAEAECSFVLLDPHQD